MTHQNPEFHLPLNELCRLLKKSKCKIALMALLGAFVIGSLALMQPISYVGEASFKEKSNNSNGMSSASLASVILNGLDSDNKSEAKTLMSSKKLLKQVAKTLELQASLYSEEMAPSLLKNASQNIAIEINYLTGLKKYALRQELLPITIKDVRFNLDFPRSLTLIFTNDPIYKVIDENLQEIGQGLIGEPFSTENTSFVILKKGHLAEKKIYKLYLRPLVDVIGDLSKKIEIKTDKDDSSLLKLKYFSQTSKTASLVLNQLMQSYQEYLKEEQSRIAREQITYLNKRESQMEEKLQLTVQDYAKKLSFELSSMGYPDSKLAMDFLNKQLEQFRKKNLAIELEIHKLETALAQKSDFLIDAYFSSESPKFLARLVEEMTRLQQELDTIKSTLSEIKPPSEKKPKQIPLEFEGINLQTSDKLYIAYHKELGEIENKILQYNFLLNQLEGREFEISSFSSIVTDMTLQKLIDEATTLVLGLQDSQNRSLKEKERMKSELEIQKRFLKVHLEQTLELLAQHDKLIHEKIQSLQHLKLRLIEQQISILENQLTQGLKVHRDNLKEEKKLLEHTEKNLISELVSLPDKWASEKIIEQQLNIKSKMVEEITKLVESKNIAANLEVIQSAPIDLATPPIHPKSPHILLFSFIGALLGAFLSSTFLIVKHGFQH